MAFTSSSGAPRPQGPAGASTSQSSPPASAGAAPCGYSIGKPALAIKEPPPVKGEPTARAAGTPAAAPTLVVDVSALKLGPSGPLAVRYGWPLSRGADTCCPSKAVRSGLQPCVPGSCPILTADSSLPANPFYATLDEPRERYVLRRL